MSLESKERDRPMRREPPNRDDRASRDSKPPGFRDSRSTKDNVTNRTDPHSIRCRVFLGNLPTEKMGRQEVEEVFGRHGKIVALSLHAHFGFVQYEDERGADNAVMKENGKVYHGKKLEINLAGDRKKDGRPIEREKERRPPPPFDRREREIDRDRERPRRSPPRERFGDHDRFPPRFDGPPDRYRHSPSPPRDNFRSPFGRHEDAFDRDRYRDEPYYGEPRDRPPLDRHGGPPDRRDPPPPDRHDFLPLDRRSYPPDRRDDPPYGRGRPHSPGQHDGPPRDRRDDRRDPYDHPREPYSDRRDDYYRRDDPYSRDYPPAKKQRSEHDLPKDDAYSTGSKLSMAVPTDCVIVVMNKQQRGYAEMVERRLKTVGLVVDVQIHGGTPLTELLDGVARKGVLYAIVITSQHEVHRSVTVNILHGTPQEHRNMPLEDAMRFVGQNFERYMQDLRERSKKSSLSSFESGNTAAAAVGAPPSSQGSEVSELLSKAALGDSLTSDQLSKLIDNLSKQQKEMGGSGSANGQGGVPASSSQTATLPVGDAQSIAKQQAELQAKILSILNPGSKTTNPTYSGFQTQQATTQKPVEAASYPVQIPTAAKSPIAPLYPPGGKPTFPAYGVSGSPAATKTTPSYIGQYSKPGGMSTPYGVSLAPAVSAPKYATHAASQASPFTAPAQPTSIAKPSVSSAYGSSQAYTSPVQPVRGPAQGKQVFRNPNASTYPPKNVPVQSAVGTTSVTARSSTPQALPRAPSGGTPRATSPATRFTTSTATGTPRAAAAPGTLPRPRLSVPASSGMPAPQGSLPSRGGTAPTRGGSLSARGGTPYSRGGAISTRGGSPSGRGGTTVARGGTISARGGTISARGGTLPARGGTLPARGGTPSTRGGTLSARGGTLPARGGTLPARGGTLPARGGTLPARGGTLPARGGTLPARGGTLSARGGTLPVHGGTPARGGILPIRGGTAVSRPGVPNSRGGLLSTRGAIPATRGGSPANRGAPIFRGLPPGRGTGTLRGMPRGAPTGRGGMGRGSPAMRGGPGGYRGRGILSQRGVPISRGAPISTIMNRRGAGGYGY